MKELFIKAMFCALLIAAVSCNKELNTTPTQSIDETEALKTSNDVKVALVGAYADLGDDDFYGGRIFMEADLLANNNDVDWSGTYQGLTQIKNKTIPVDNSFVANTWLAGYKAINDVNNVLSALAVVDEKDRARVEGEAKFIRGAAYFDLVRMYAKAWNDGDPATNPGVPIILTPTRTVDASSQTPRSTVAQVYQQAINDLQEAEAALPQSNGIFASKAAAAAMLSRIYLQQENYRSAADAANRAIETSGATLVSNYAEAFGATNTSEDIFAMQVNSTSGTQGFNEFYSAAQRGDIQVTPEHFALYDSSDERLNLFYNSGGSDYVGKFEEVYGNVHLIRLAEMYLVRAESNFRLGTATGDEPVNDINRIRNRVGLPPYETIELTLDKILKERRLELAFEGFALHDIKRLKGSVGNLPWNSPKLIFPIPEREIRVNASLTQNEGY